MLLHPNLGRASRARLLLGDRCKNSISAGHDPAHDPANVLSYFVSPVEQWRPVVGSQELRRRNNQERIKFVMDMAHMAGFELLTNVFLTQLKSVSNCRNYGRDVRRTIVRSPLYKPICKLLNSDPDF